MDDGRSIRGRLQRVRDAGSAPLRTTVWFAGLLLIAAWVAWRLNRSTLTQLDFEQQFHLVRALARLDLTHALTGRSHPASPPGYGFFALPFDLALRAVTSRTTAYKVASIGAVFALGVASIVASRAAGHAACSVREVVNVGIMTAAPTSLACLTEAFHPSDLVATAACLFAFAASLRGRHRAAIGWLAFGLFTKQWVIVVIGVLAAVQHGWRAIKYVVVSIGLFAVAVAPFAIANRGATLRALAATRVAPRPHVLLGWIDKWLDLKPWSTPAVFESRILPLALAGAMCLWLRERKQVDSRALAAALAVVLLVRAVLDPAGYQYYVTPGLAFLVLAGDGWQWPAGALAGSLALDHYLPGFFGSPTVRTAAASTVIMTILLLGALLLLRARTAELPHDGSLESA